MILVNVPAAVQRALTEHLGRTPSPAEIEAGVQAVAVALPTPDLIVEVAAGQPPVEVEVEARRAIASLNQ